MVCTSPASMYQPFETYQARPGTYRLPWDVPGQPGLYQPLGHIRLVPVCPGRPGTYQVAWYVPASRNVPGSAWTLISDADTAGAGADPACAPTLFAIAPNAPPRPRSLCLVGRRVRPLRDEDEVEAKACLHRPLHLHEWRVPAHLEAGRGGAASAAGGGSPSSVPGLRRSG